MLLRPAAAPGLLLRKVAGSGGFLLCFQLGRADGSRCSCQRGSAAGTPLFAPARRLPSPAEQRLSLWSAREAAASAGSLGAGEEGGRGERRVDFGAGAARKKQAESTGWLGVRAGGRSLPPHLEVNPTGLCRTECICQEWGSTLQFKVAMPDGKTKILSSVWARRGAHRWGEALDGAK